MTKKQQINPIKIFEFEGKELPVSFVETTQVTDGVECDVYVFIGDSTKDLGIIRVRAGKKTPLQKVLKGDKTIEGYMSGKGILTITKPDGKKEITEYGNLSNTTNPVAVEIGDLMQWEADKDCELVAYEICFPPYENGRYENLEL